METKNPVDFLQNLKKFTPLLIIIGILIVVLGVFNFIFGTKNAIVTKEEGVKTAWSQVENVYQRRYDLIPNLVATVQGVADFEKETFTQVTEARSNATSFKITDEVLNNPDSFRKFQQMQGDLTAALSRLMVVSENYPQLKANENFLSLQSQLEGSENRITVERQKFNEAAKEYNIYIKMFPQSFVASMFNFKEKSYFQVTNEKANEAPVVDFNK